MSTSARKAGKQQTSSSSTPSADTTSRANAGKPTPRPAEQPAADGTPSQAQQLRQDIERIRQQLGDTVEALTDKLDVPT